MEGVGDGGVADAVEHVRDSVVEVLELQQAERAFIFEVMDDALIDIIDEGKIFLSGAGGCLGDGLVDPAGVVAGHLVAADLKHGEVSCDANHRGGVVVFEADLVVEEWALQWVAVGTFFELLDFADELTDVVKLSVNRNVADVGDRVDVV